MLTSPEEAVRQARIAALSRRVHWLGISTASSDDESDPDACPHWSVELKRRVVKNGAVHVLFQCDDCGVPVSKPIGRGLVAAYAALGVEPDEFDDELLARTRAALRAAALVRSGIAGNYGAYLRSPGWLNRRSAAIRNSGGRCESCDAAAPLEVHHLTYRRLGAELPEDLVALCRACHEERHGGVA
jgi:hypothetical protein